VKIAILVVLVILVAPNIAKQFGPKDKDASTRRSGGPLYRLVRRFGLARALGAVVVGLVAVSLLAYYAARRA
jgi:hypothetical protein